jgi:hypothetical protein
MENEQNDVMVSPDITPAVPAAPAAKNGKPNIKAMTGDERKKYNLAKVNKSRQKAKEKQDVTNFIYSSATEPTKAEARKILECRGLRNPHVIDTVYRLVLQAAEQNNIYPNRFLFAHGIVNTLKSYELNEPRLLSGIPEEEVTGELSNRAELYGLYDAGIGPRESTTFEEFLEIRQHCKTDAFYLGKEILHKDFVDCHQAWTDYFPKFDPTGLHPGYTQKQAIKWLSDASDVKNFLLLASRSSFKSSWSHVWLLSLILCFPDVRVLLVSETRPLAKDFIGVIRSYFEAMPGQETRFQQLFPEFTIPMGDGSVLSLDCPMAHLRLPQSIETTSMDSAVAGRRFDIGLFDDPISNTSCGNDTQIQASHDKFLALLKLRETSGLVLVLGTPWNEDDMCARLIRQAKGNQDSSWTYRIDPAFIVKPEARFKLTPTLLPTLREDEIESFLFPERLDWKFLKQEISNSPSFFLSQNLCIFPKPVDSEIRCTFIESDLRAATRPVGAFEKTVFSRNVAALDRAFSVAKTADYSALCIGRTLVRNLRPILAVLNVVMDRVTESGLVDMCVNAIIKYSIEYFVLEKDKGFEALVSSIQRQLMLRGVPAPQFRSVGIPGGARNRQAKARRVKTLELPLTDGRLWFAVNENIDNIYQQFVRYDGVTGSGSSDGSKDDIPDAVSLCYENFMPKSNVDIPEEDLKVQKQKEEDEANERRRLELRQANDAMFSGGMPVAQQPRLDDDPAAEPNPVEDRRTMLSKILPPGMRA